MERRTWMLAGVVTLTVAALGCGGVRQMRVRSSALEYLYPTGKTSATPARDVTLKVPVRVGLAFAPGVTERCWGFTGFQTDELLTRMAEVFREKDFVGSVEVIPPMYVTPEGSFEELNRLARAFGFDLMALVSYDQLQLGETTPASLTYLTIVGAYVVPGEKNETRTLMDTAVLDIRSRALLFRAAGESTVKHRSTPVGSGMRVRLDSERGFDLATDEMIANLQSALDAFREQVKTGTVHGEGTPAVRVVRDPSAPGGTGAGAMGAGELLAAVAMAAVLLRRRRARGGIG
jgi:rhombotail lipoprotein